MSNQILQIKNETQVPFKPQGANNPGCCLFSLIVSWLGFKRTLQKQTKILRLSGIQS